MEDENFLQQLKEDIKLIKDNYIMNNPLLEKDEYAFNYWVLSKLYNVEEECIDSNITEYSDDGCDCFVFFEESKELFIIQNKYYTTTTLDPHYVKTDFLYRPLNSLSENAYRRSAELQTIFNKYKNDPELKIYLNLYVTNNNVSDELKNDVEKFTYSDNIQAIVSAKIYTLADMKNVYYEERKTVTRHYSCIFKTKNDGTVLNIDSTNYNLPSLTDAKYILTPVKLIYEIVKECKEKNYMLFEENIREYLGNKGVNSHIAKTLEDENDRDNFFYYNNGITVICDSVQKITLNELIHNKGFKTENPQIVNGCQTVNTIFETLNKYPESELEDTFKNTYVMVKLLVLDKNSDSNKKLYQDIVKYNNSQNAISEKNFAANKRIFLNLQDDLRDLGFLLTVKQSDSNKFKTQENFNTYRPKLQKYTELFGVEFNRLEDNIIQLDKFLQVLLAFKNDGYDAFTKKSKILKVDSPIYNDLIEFIKNGSLTKNDYINLYLLFLKAEKEKKSSDDQRTPIPYYLLSFLGRDLKGLDGEQTRKCFRYIFESKENLNAIYSFYKRVTKRYKINMKNDKGIEYNKMIKTQIDNTLLEKTISDELEMEENSENKKIVNSFRNHTV